MTGDNNDSRLISAEELAGLLGLPVASIRRYARENRIPHYRLGRLLRFDVGEVRAAIRDRGGEGAGGRDD